MILSIKATVIKIGKLYLIFASLSFLRRAKPNTTLCVVTDNGGLITRLLYVIADIREC